MRRYRLLLGLLPAAPMVLAAASCDAPGASRVDLVMRAPQGALGGAKAVTLSVFDAAKGTCDAATGHVAAIPSEEEGTLTFELSSTGCPTGVAWCKDVTLDKDGITKIFAVVASNEGGVIAEGCTTQEVDQDPLTVDIKVHLANVAKCCSDGAIQPGEQCEGPPVAGQCGGIAETEVCDATCQTKEIQLANDSVEPLLDQGDLGQDGLALTFSDGKDDLQGGLRAAFTPSSDSIGKADIHIRALTRDLLSIKDPFPFSHQLRIPIICTDPSGTGTQREQRSPSIANVSDLRTAVVYTSDEETVTRREIFMSAQTQDGCAEQKPSKVSVKTTPSDNAIKPDVAGGPDRTALIVWTRAGKVKGRFWQAPADGLGPGVFTPSDFEMALDLAPNALNVTDVRVAAWSGGWVIVYAGQGKGDEDGVFMNTVLPSGMLGTEKLVNVVTTGPQDQPDVAVLKNGNRMVVWRSDGDVYFQLYDAMGVEIGNQFESLNTKDAAMQQHPAVAAAGDVGQFFVAAWEDGADDIYARLVDGDADGGFLQNSVTGQNDPFRATHPGTTGIRRLPAVAVGGHIVIGWHDESMDSPGVYVRRFPLAN